MMTNSRFKYLNESPNVSESSFIAPSANLIGAVTVGENSSIWYNVTLRADIQKITIGNNSNIQDNSVVHLSDTLGVNIGDWVTCGHKCLLHACEVEDESLIGMGAIIMDGSVIGARSIVGAGSLVTMNTIIPSGSLVVGSPAKVIKKLDLEEQKNIKTWAKHYVDATKEFKKIT